MGPPGDGMQFGPYRLLREIGGGGMGVVHEAADEALGRTVALKVISPQLAADPAFRERFRREARALAALDSPHVVQVYAYGELGGCPYLATQLLPDGDLGAWLGQHGAPPLRVALELVAQVADGLADAHDAGLVHRDIKPGNVLLRRRGGTLSAHLGDFGVARWLGAPAGSLDAGTVGTPSWMAPELHTGAPADARADIYALGCLLWATLTGRAPYDGATDDEVARAHLRDPVPQLPGGPPPVATVNRILRTAMAKDPADRYSSAGELRDDLRRAVALPERVWNAPGASRLPLVASVAASALLPLVAAVSWRLAAGDAEQAAPDPPQAAGAPAAEERAARSFARALLQERVVADRERAVCTARAWIDDVGLDRLVSQGYFTDDMEYVDLAIGRAGPATQLALAAATMACVEG